MMHVDTIAKCVFFASLLSLTFSIGWRSSKKANLIEEYVPRHATDNSEEQCSPSPKGGIDWLISVRDPEYGWGEDTARAVITLAVNNWTMCTQQEVDHIKLQLTAQITKALLWSHSKAIPPIDLALYIQALVAIGKNPHNFYGFDLVADLLNRANTTDPHPMLVLALCDANAVEMSHLISIRKYLEQKVPLGRTDADLMAMAVKAFACAASLDSYLGKFKSYTMNAANFLIRKQKDNKSFGNLYSTALIVQALIASKVASNWDMEGALNYIHSHSLSEQTVMGVYYSELALEASTYPFVKDIYLGKSREHTAKPKAAHGSRLHYTIRNNQHPDVYLTIGIHVPKGSNFFNVMKLSAAEDSNFSFSHYLDSDGLPVIYAMNGIPNNAEENYFWRLCRQIRMHENATASVMHTVHHSPALENANESHHFIMWYRDTHCEKDNS